MIIDEANNIRFYKTDEKSRAKSRNYYFTHKEQLAQKAKDKFDPEKNPNYDEDKEKRNEYARKYYQQNKERIRRKQNERYAKNNPNAHNWEKKIDDCKTKIAAIQDNPNMDSNEAKKELWHLQRKINIYRAQEIKYNEEVKSEEQQIVEETIHVQNIEDKPQTFEQFTNKLIEAPSIKEEQNLDLQIISNQNKIQMIKNLRKNNCGIEAYILDRNISRDEYEQERRIINKFREDHQDISIKDIQLLAKMPHDKKLIEDADSLNDIIEEMIDKYMEIIAKYQAHLLYVK